MYPDGRAATADVAALLAVRPLRRRRPRAADDGGAAARPRPAGGADRVPGARARRADRRGGRARRRATSASSADTVPGVAQPDRLGEIEELLSGSESSLAEVADAILEAVGAARVSLSEIDPSRRCVRDHRGARRGLARAWNAIPARDVDPSPERRRRQGVRLPRLRSAAWILPTARPDRSRARLPLRRISPAPASGRARRALEPALRFDRARPRPRRAHSSSRCSEVSRSPSPQPDEIAPTSVLVCHDDPLVGHGIARLLEETGLARASLARSPADAVRSGPLRAPDVVIGDLALGGRRIDAWIDELRAAGVDAPLLVVAPHDGGDSLGVALAAGATGIRPSLRRRERALARSRRGLAGTVVAPPQSMCAARRRL